jgi:hypothetical protein
MIVLAQYVQPGSVGSAFTNIPQNFTHLQLRYQARSTVAGNPDVFYLRFNNDTTGPYYYTYTYNNYGSSTVTTSSNGGYMQLGLTSGASANANYFGGLIVDIYNYSSSTKTKGMKALSGYDANGTGSTCHTTGYWSSTAPITQISWGTAANYDAVGSVATLYGIASANTYGVSAP